MTHDEPTNADEMTRLPGLADVTLQLAWENGVQLLQELQQSNSELDLVIDSVIEAWSRALELHDDQKVGHNQRVANITLQLAKAVGISDSELVHIRRGALLHDVGKIGIPKSILYKRGPYTTEEWSVMRQHPVYAYQMLSPIKVLLPALDIPYCHRERWNGSGYPRGLVGEEIPIAARIFAVVDVWDILCMDRPYRKAWPKDKAYLYLLTHAGRQFDSRIVDAFFTLRMSLAQSYTLH